MQKVVVLHSSPDPGTALSFPPEQWQIIINADELSLGSA